MKKPLWYVLLSRAGKFYNKNFSIMFKNLFRLITMNLLNTRSFDAQKVQLLSLRICPRLPVFSNTAGRVGPINLNIGLFYHMTQFLDILFRMGWGAKSPPPTTFSPVTSTNIEISPHPLLQILKLFTTPV